MIKTTLSALANQSGSNKGGFLVVDGTSWYIKVPQTAIHARNEVLAARIYAMAGIMVPHVELCEVDGKVGVASRIVHGLAKVKDWDTLCSLRDGFVIDAWLANWDVIGLEFDNTLTLDGTAVRLDTGGALLFRAMGGEKGSAFGAKVTEIETLRNGRNHASTKAFAAMTSADFEAGMAKLRGIDVADLAELCAEFNLPEVFGILAARREFLLG